MEPLFSATLHRRLYNERTILIGTFIGGPLLGAYVLTQNFKALGQEHRVAPTWIVASVAMVLVGLTALVPVLEKIPIGLFSFLFCLAAHKAARTYQGAALDLHREQGGLFHSAWKLMGPWLVLVVVMLGIWLAAAA